jgi:membrane protease YdiL (CAAX protease family)
MANGILTRRDPRFILFGLGLEETSWRGVGLLATVFFGSLAIAAILTPLTFWAAEAFVSWRQGGGALDYEHGLLGYGIDVYFDRLRWVPILLGLPWLMLVCHLWSLRGLGLGRGTTTSGTTSFFGAYIGGLVLVGLLTLAQKSFTTILPRPEGVHWGATLLKAALGGLILGFLEETIFRGLILRIFYTATRQPWLALAATSAFFAYTHFKVPASVLSHFPPGARWDTGWIVGWWVTVGITVDFDWPHFLALWMLGMVLGALMLRTGSLLPGIGLHAGLVAAMFIYRDACLFPPDPARAIWGGSGLTDGWAAFVVLTVVFIFLAGRRAESWQGRSGVLR